MLIDVEWWSANPDWGNSKDNLVSSTNKLQGNRRRQKKELKRLKVISTHYHVWTFLDVVARMEAMYGFNSMEFPLPKLAWLELLVSTDQHWVPNTTPFPGGMSQPPSCRLTTLDLFYHGGAEIPSHENRYISWVQICLPCPYMLLDSTTIFAFRECLIHCLGILHSIGSDQETWFHSKEVQAHPMELTVLTT